MTSINADDLYKQLLAISANSGLPSNFFDEVMQISYTTALPMPNVTYRDVYASTYSPPEPKKIYLGMYVYVEKWPVMPAYEKSKNRVCINVDCKFYLEDDLFYIGAGNCSNCSQPLKHYAVEVTKPITMDVIIHQPLGVKCFKQVWDKEAKASEIPNKRIIVPYPEYAFELGGTIIEDNLTPLKGIIDALKRSEKVHEYWYVLCASLQRYEAKFQPGRGLVII